MAFAALVLTPPSNAQDRVTVPTTAGQTLTASWQGTILPGVNTSSECGPTDLGADAHELEIVVPAGTYDQVTVQATATVSYDGPNDVILTVVFPDGSTLSGDQGFVDTDESVGFANPQPGVYRFIACMFLGAVPQPYFTIDIDTTGALVAAYSDTRQGGSVALPAFLRQSGGTSFLGRPRGQR